MNKFICNCIDLYFNTARGTEFQTNPTFSDTKNARTVYLYLLYHSDSKLREDAFKQKYIQQ